MIPKNLNILDYPKYVPKYAGIGDTICYLNMLENIGKEKSRKIELYVVRRSEYFQRVSDIYDSLDLKFVNVHFSDFKTVAGNGENEYIVFRPPRNWNSSWTNDWLYGCGLRECIGYNNMVKFKDQIICKNDVVGVSFTIASNPSRNISNQSVINVIEECIDNNKNVVYFGFRNRADKYILEKFGDKIEYCDYDLKYTIKRIGECSEFIGADSGMAWLAAFHRVKTKILIGKSFGCIPNIFGDIPWVCIEVEK